MSQEEVVAGLKSIRQMRDRGMSIREKTILEEAIRLLEEQ